jgi:Raf kinase inhibitor-like YbhB/YbcL family protein
MLKNLFLLLTLAVSSSTMALNLSSESWHEFAFVGSNYLCPNQGGDNISPELSWTEVPLNTKSFLLLLHDPDAPHSAGFVHWVVYIHDPKIKSIATGFMPTTSSQIVFGLNGMEKNVYFGPCPPSGTGLHRYIFTLYALNTQLKLNKIAQLHQNQLVNSLYGKVINQASFTGFYRNAY